MTKPVWLGQPEGRHLEYKAAAARPEALARTVVGFLNGDGGVLVIGVHDDGSIEGIPSPLADSARVQSLLVDRIEPPPVGLIDVRVERVLGGEVLAVEVTAGQALYAERRNNLYGFWVRSGASTRAASWAEIRERQRNAPSPPEPVDWSAELQGATETTLVLVAQSRQPTLGVNTKSLAATVESARQEIDGRAHGWTVLPPGSSRSKRGIRSWGARDEAKYLSLSTTEDQLVVRFEGRGRFLVWQQPPHVKGPMLYPYPATEGPATFLRLLSSLAKAGTLSGRLDLCLALWNSEGWVLGPGRPNSYAWMLPHVTWERSDDSSIAVRHISDWQSVRDRPEQEAFRLVASFYEWFGYEQEAIPFWDPTGETFRFE